jgi:long-chain acyl-CoA synthetase
MKNNDSISTLNDLFCRVAAAANARAVLWQDEFGQWQPISSDQIYQHVRALAKTFLGWGVQKGDRIALIAENRWEWAITDFATLAIGAVDVPIYPTLTGEQIAAQLDDAGCRIAVVSTRLQFDKLNAVRDKTRIERILMMDPAPPEGAIDFSEVIEGADALGSERDPVFDALMRAAEPKDMATLIYTSGTTGTPKGVVLTHGNIAANINYASEDFVFGPTDALISFLPLSHVTARALDYIMYSFGVQVAYCSQFDKLPEAMRQIRPTVFVGVPRVFEKIRQEVERRAALSPVKKRLFAWAIGVGGEHIDTVYDGCKPKALKWKLADKLVYSKVREAFGGRVRIFVPGGAPLNGLHRWGLLSGRDMG